MTHRYFNRRQWLRATGAWSMGGAGLWGGSVQAAVWMEVEQAQRVLWPSAERFQPHVITLGEPALTLMAQRSETRVPRSFAPRIWEAVIAGKQGGWVIVDRVVGKYDLIDYAVGFALDGEITGLEILVYRESHGSEIRQPAWRRQFKGRQSPQTLRFADDIKNISGATLSCQHVTEGVQRLSALVGLLKVAA